MTSTEKYLKLKIDLINETPEDIKQIASVLSEENTSNEEKYDMLGDFSLAFNIAALCNNYFSAGEKTVLYTGVASNIDLTSVCALNQTIVLYSFIESYRW